jgi:hypothetical protein
VRLVTRPPNCGVMRLSEVIAELRHRSEPVPRPARLPTAVEVTAVEATIGHTLPDDYRRFLLEASDVVLGTLEPATVTEPSSHTYLPRVIASTFNASALEGHVIGTEAE